MFSSLELGHHFVVSLSWALCMLGAFSVLQPLVDGVAFAAEK